MPDPAETSLEYFEGHALDILSICPAKKAYKFNMSCILVMLAETQAYAFADSTEKGIPVDERKSLQ